MRLSPNFHVGVVLGIATASVVLALSGCVSGPASGQASASPAAAPSSQTSAAVLEPFSEGERERILAVQGIVEQAAAEHGIDPDLINAVIWVESRFEPDAKSSAGARGLMQLMPATAAYLAKRMGEHNPRSYDPEFNVRAGALYLSEMIEKFGDEQYAVAAYHAGPGNVKRWLETGEAFPEYSQTYVAKVMDARGRFEGDERHGGTNAARGAVPARQDAKSQAAAEQTRTKNEPAPVIDDEDEPLEVPDLDSIPSAAEIHGMATEIHVGGEERPVTTMVATLESEDIEAVFVVHEDLDANPHASSGWASPGQSSPGQSSPGQSSPPPSEIAKPKRGPAPRTKPGPEQAPVQAGLGVLPDL